MTDPSAPILRVGGRFFVYDSVQNRILETDRAGALALKRLRTRAGRRAMAPAGRAVEADALEPPATKHVGMQPHGPRLRYDPPATRIVPRAIEFILTGACNLHCDYCATRDRYRGRDGANDVLDEPTALAALRLLRPYIDGGAPQLKFFGGEPLLAFEVIRSIVQTVRAWGIEGDKIIATNGLLLNDETIDFLATHRFLTLISLDGSPEVHNAYRTDGKGRGSYEWVVENLQRFRARHPEVFRTHVAINMVVAPEFAGRFREQVQHLLALGICPDQINPNDTTVTAAPGTCYTAAQLRRLRREKAAVRDEVLRTGPSSSRTAFAGCYSIYGGLHWPSAEPTGDDEDQPVAQEGVELEDCQGHAWNMITVWPDGKLSCCLEFARSPAVEFGDVHAGALDLGRLAAFQDSFRESVITGPCGNCWAVRLCPLTGCYKEFVSFGCKPGWQRPELCNALRSDLADRLQDALRLHMQL